MTVHSQDDELSVNAKHNALQSTSEPLEFNKVDGQLGTTRIPKKLMRVVKYEPRVSSQPLLSGGNFIRVTRQLVLDKMIVKLDRNVHLRHGKLDTRGGSLKRFISGAIGVKMMRVSASSAERVLVTGEPGQNKTADEKQKRLLSAQKKTQNEGVAAGLL